MKLLPLFMIIFTLTSPLVVIAAPGGPHLMTKTHPLDLRPSQPGPITSAIILQPEQYREVPYYLEAGQQLIFSITSSIPIALYIVLANRVSSFSANDRSSFIYTSQGNYISGDVRVNSSDTYYIILYNDVDSDLATVKYTIQSIPVNIYSIYHSQPAPIGIADYGISNITGRLSAYTLDISQIYGYAHITSMNVFNSTPPAGISPYGASLQLNSVLQVNTSGGSYYYLLQNVPSFLTNNRTLTLVDNIWNYSGSYSLLLPTSISGNGSVFPASNINIGHFYSSQTSTIHYLLPLNLELVTSVTLENGNVKASFGYSISGIDVIKWYDNVTLFTPDATSAAIIVSGNKVASSGNYLDAELVFGGEGDGESTYFNNMNASLYMHYKLINGSVISPPSVYGFGSSTAEAADNLEAISLNGDISILPGKEDFGLPLTTQVTPSPRQYDLTFMVKGLPNGATWMVDVNGSVVESSSNKIVLTVNKGNYSYNIEPIFGFSFSPESGSVSIVGNSIVYLNASDMIYYYVIFGLLILGTLIATSVLMYKNRSEEAPINYPYISLD